MWLSGLSVFVERLFVVNCLMGDTGVAHVRELVQLDLPLDHQGSNRTASLFVSLTRRAHPHVAQIWSTMHIYVNSQFETLTCPGGSGIVGRACPTTDEEL